MNVKNGPEHKIQEAIIAFLRTREWLVRSTHGNMYQCGFPDLFCTHSRYGHRWVEVKNPEHYVFTPAQLQFFPMLCAHGSGVWIMVAASDLEYQKLFKTANWYQYLEILK